MSSTSNTQFRGVDGVVQRLPAADLPSTLKPNEVLLKITHSGLCATDLLLIPHGAALGHEGVGIVEAIGSEVTEFKVGDRAGAGYLRNACGKCTYCLSGQEIYCLSRDIYGEASFTTGTFSAHYIGLSTYLHKIPDAISSEHAAPLQCAGPTVYNALINNMRAGDRVGIVGIGGLGHLAIQFASKLGAETVVFSRNRGKEEEARKLGADEFYVLGEEDSLERPVDVLLVTGMAPPDWSKFMTPKILARRGRVITIAVPPKGMEVPAQNMLMNGYTLTTNLVASRKSHADMLAFAARNNITPIVETFEMSDEGFAEALGKLKDGSIRYRGVLVAKERL